MTRDIAVGQTITLTPTAPKQIKGKVTSVSFDGHNDIYLISIAKDDGGTESFYINNYTYEIEKPKLPTKLGSVIYVRAPNGFGYSGYYYRIGTDWYDVNGSAATPTFLEQTNWSNINLDDARLDN